MVAGNHDGADAGLAAARDGLRHFVARGIYHCHEAEEGEVLFHLVDVQLFDTLLNITHGHSQDPIGLVREGTALRHDALAVLLTHRRASSLVEHLTAEGHERFRRSLHKGHEPALTPMDGGHALPVRVERQLTHSGQRFLLEEFVIQCELDQGHFGWIARDGGAAVGPPHALGIVAVDDRIEERRILLGLDRAGHASGDHQTAFLHLDFEMVHIETNHAHPVFGQRPCLVRADDGGATQGFNGCQLLDERMAFGHALAAQRQGQRHSGEQSFRHVRHDDADPEDRADPEAQAHGDADDEKDSAHGDRQHCDHMGDLRDLFLQRAEACLHACGEAGDLAEFRLHAGGEHHRPASAGEHGGTGEYEIGNVLEMSIDDRLRRPPLRLGFACERGEVDTHVGSFDEPGVGRDLLSLLDQEHVTRHDLAPRHVTRLIASQHPGPGGEEAMKGMHCALRLIFLKEGKDGVDDYHTENRPAERGHPFAGLHEFCRERQTGGDPEQHGQEVGELMQESPNQ
jgi:hypothetical protein